MAAKAGPGTRAAPRSIAIAEVLKMNIFKQTIKVYRASIDQSGTDSERVAAEEEGDLGE